MCKNTTYKSWDLKQILWMLSSIVQPIFLDVAVVWGKAVQKFSWSAKIARKNRSAHLLATGAFKATPGLPLVVLLNITPLEIKTKQAAMNPPGS